MSDYLLLLMIKLNQITLLFKKAVGEKQLVRFELTTFCRSKSSTVHLGDGAGYTFTVEHYPDKHVFIVAV